jgi:membrane protein DedA with SNARE-associated domain
VTGSLANAATSVVNDLGLGGVFVLMLLDSACVPIPSEVTMLFAGFNVATGHYSLFEITVVGVAGNVVGSWVAYAVGYFGRVELFERSHLVHGRHLERADRWFGRYGSITVLVARVIPLVRTFISLPAGVARMPFGRFTAFTLTGCIPWVLLFAIAGDAVKSHWTSWRDAFTYVDYVVVAVVVIGAAYAVVRLRRAARDPKPAADVT